MTPSETRRAETPVSMRSDEFVDDPPATYAELRSRCPVAWSTADEQWMVTAYEDVRQVLQDAEHISNEAYNQLDQPPLLVLSQDPPGHTKYRRLLTSFFAPNITEALMPKLESYSTELFDRFVAAGRADLVLDYGNPFPALIVLELCGLPTADWQRFAEPNHAVQFEKPGTPGFDEAIAGLVWIAGQLRELAERRRTDPRDDLVSHLATAEVDGELLPLDDVAGILMTIVGGGVDTTTSLYANAILALHRDHEARQRLIDEPDAIPAACEEFLRFYTPAQSLSRSVRGDYVVEDERLSDGDVLAVCIAAANRDPEVFENPESLQLDRFPNRHTAFGLGIHRCIGSHIARAMIQLMLRHTLERVPDYVVDEPDALPYRSPIVNGWIRMPVSFTPSAPIATTSTLPV